MSKCIIVVTDHYSHPDDVRKVRFFDESPSGRESVNDYIEQNNRETHYVYIADRVPLRITHVVQWPDIAPGCS